MYELFTKKNSIRLLVISDLHLGSVYDRIDLLYKAYEYACFNNIKYVLNLGDLFDSNMPHNKEYLKIQDFDEQVSYAIDNYPYSESIKTLMLYGNHDYYSKITHNNDMVKKFSEERTDLIHLGYGESYLNIKNNYIKLQHEISCLKNYKQNIETYITLLGHYHKFRVDINGDTIYIHVPSLSNLGINRVPNIPSILDIKLSFFNELFSDISVKYIDMDNEIAIGEFNTTINVKKKKHTLLQEQTKKMH